MSAYDNKSSLPSKDQALPGRSNKMAVSPNHFVTGHSIQEPFDSHLQKAIFGLGCFWGAERKFWDASDVAATAVGYAAGHTENPSYEEVCSGMTGHNEVVLVIFDPEKIPYSDLLKIFWESHDPTQGMRQGNDRGTQYRSGIYTFNSEQQSQAEESKAAYANSLKVAGKNTITTEVIAAPDFFYAEDYHQQYLAKNPGGYCGLGGTGVAFPCTD